MKREPFIEDLFNDIQVNDYLIDNVEFAFTSRARQLAKQRSGGVSELTRRNDRPLEVAHLNHSRNSNYNDIDNAIVVTDTEHAGFHIVAKKKGVDIGLAEYQNEWAIGAILKRVFDWSRCHNIPDEITQQEVNEAINLWDKRL